MLPIVPLDIYFLCLMGYITLPLVFLYILFRNRMIKSRRHQLRYFSRREVMKLTFANLFLMLSFGLSSIWFYFSLLQRIVITDMTLFNILSTIYFLLLILIAFGDGIYVCSIVIEQFTLSGLKHVKGYKTQFIATYLFHGPISHLYIYGSGILSFFVLYLIEKNFMKVYFYQFPVALLFISGLLMGVGFSIAMIYSNTYHWLTSILVILFLLLFVDGLFSKISPLMYPIGAFLFALFGLAAIVLTLYILIKDRYNIAIRVEGLLDSLV